MQSISSLSICHLDTGAGAPCGLHDIHTGLDRVGAPRCALHHPPTHRPPSPPSPRLLEDLVDPVGVELGVEVVEAVVLVAQAEGVELPHALHQGGNAGLPNHH